MEREKREPNCEKCLCRGCFDKEEGTCTINDFAENYEEPKEEKKPILKLVKGGAK